MACGRRLPRTTRCCERRSRRTAAGCSSTPVMACAPRSRRRSVRLMRRWPRSGCWSCRCGWDWRPVRPSCGEGDYFGAVLNRAARVMAAGHGGQILLAESTAGLLSGVDMLDLGSRRLRDLPTPVGVFQVRAPGLRSDFRHCGRWTRLRETCDPRSPASSAGHPSSPRLQAALQCTSAGDVDRGGWRWQDPAGHRGRGAAGR